MRSTAILFRRDAAPRAVLLTAADDGLLIDYSGIAAGSDHIAWWRLARHRAEDGSLRVSQLGELGWELRLNPGGDRALIERIAERRFGRWRSRLRKLGSLKLLLAVPVLALTLAEYMPARAVASLWPKAAQERLTRGPVLSLSASLCTRREGQDALRALVQRLDPVAGGTVKLEVHNIPEFIMTALPGSTIEILRQPAVDTDAEQLAALLAHELSHVRHGDAMAAVLRENGLLATLGMLLRGDDNRLLVMNYSGAEEDRADREAIAALARAGIPLLLPRRCSNAYAKRTRVVTCSRPSSATSILEWVIARGSGRKPRHGRARSRHR